MILKILASRGRNRLLTSRNGEHDGTELNFNKCDQQHNAIAGDGMDTPQETHPT